MIKGPCKNHPERTARRRCFSCGAYICAACQIRGLHHYFCSPRCQLKFQLGEFGNHALELLESLLPSLQVKNRNALLGKLIAGALLVVLVLPLMSLVLVLFMNLRMQGRIESIETSLKDMAASSQPAPERVKLSDPRLRISHPATGAMLTSKLVSIEGLADTNLVVIVSRNGKIFSAMLPNAGRFASPELVLDNGENHFEVSAVDVAGKVVGFDKIVVNYRPLAVRSMAADFSRGDRRSRQIALTFDGGSNDNSAAPILDILQQQSLEATIFLTGGFVQNFPDLTRQIVAHGHEVGNHTWSHPHLTSFEMNYQQRTLPQVTRDFVHQQLTLTAALFEKVTGKPMAKLWRAPYGEHNEEIRQWAAELGYRHIGWTHGRTADESMDTMDWVADTTSAAYRSANEILHRLLRIADSDGDAANGGIVLMHLGSQRRSDEAYQMLPQLISGLRAKQYEIVTVSELLN
jgi:peptidoglycan/xylan/chitin deacetylase (PgdA/CDA1 family)